MRILFFDDERIRYDIFKKRVSLGGDVATTVVYSDSLQDCQNKLVDHMSGKTFYDIIHFDHDIQDHTTKEWYNSTELANWFVNNCPKDKIPTMAVIHSVSPHGSWALYHIFCRLTKCFMSPFRIDTNEYDNILNIIKGNQNDKV